MRHAIDISVKFDILFYGKVFIKAKTLPRAESWGEHIGIWVTAISSNRTEVEVVSRRAGPAALFWYDWEKPILNSTAAALDQPMPFPDPPIVRK